MDRTFRYEGLVSAAGDVLRVRTFIDSPVTGDTPMEWRYSEYRDFGGVRFPARIERVIAGQPWYDLHVSAVRINTATAFAVPPEVAANPVPVVTTCRPRSWRRGCTSSPARRTTASSSTRPEGLVVIEAPLGEPRSDAVIAKVSERRSPGGRSRT